MTGRCESNSAHYGHLAHALARAVGVAKLPSVGLCVNGSRVISFLKGDDSLTSFESRKGQNKMTIRRSSQESLLATWGNRH
ncbi:hypothetical protein QE152_g38492 [Popillia japonica]|uniref:Uncharacterized protein n=1 Tax=Popillia japonica TaxID=7064 RepID=A0AAW1HWN3_POPJA